MGLGCLGDRYITIKNIARLVFDIRLIVLIAEPVFGYISIESQRKRNADVLYHASVKYVELHEKSGVSPKTFTEYQPVASQPMEKRHRELLRAPGRC